MEIAPRRLLRPVACTVAALLAVAWPASSQAAPVLRSADIRIVIRTADTCDVSMAFAVTDGGVLDHRIRVPDDHTSVDLQSIRGARAVQESRAIGRTRSLVLETGSQPYELAYSVRKTHTEDRCPLWVPAAPADGVSRAVRISVELPAGMVAAGTLPAFRWNGGTGIATLGHIPAFVRVPYTPAGESSWWSVTTAMDALAVAVFAAASVLWMLRRRR
jgi:hypothetical protein